jgi:hypothetical protein
MTLKGEVGPDGKLHLDVPGDIPPGPVEVILRPLKPPGEPAEGLMQFLLGASARMEAAGCHFMDDDEVREYVEQMRSDDVDQVEEIERQAERRSIAGDRPPCGFDGRDG